jgi:hypothetical protein
MKTLSRCIALCASLVLLAPAARPQGWNAPWQHLESGIDVQFNQVNAQTCTWRFKNLSGVSTIQSMNFTITYPAPGQGGVYTQKTDKEVLPSPLGPGQMAGGWAAYTAPANCTTVRINILDRKWQ